MEVLTIILIAYLSYLGNLLYVLSMAVLCLLPVVLVAVLLFRRFLKAQNNDYDRDSVPLRVFKRISSVTYRPAKRFLSSLFAFVRDSGVYWKIWLALWLFYFNVFAIVLEFIAFYLYFVVSFDFANIYRQVYKLLRNCKYASAVGVSILRRLRRENEDEFHQPERQNRFQF